MTVRFDRRRRVFQRGGAAGAGRYAGVPPVPDGSGRTGRRHRVSHPGPDPGELPQTPTPLLTR